MSQGGLMTLRQPFLAVMMMIVLPAWGMAADGQDAKPATQAAEGNLFGDISARANGDPALLSQPSRYSEWDTRFGWWIMWTHGSQVKTGQYQDMGSSPFFDVDGLSSDGNKTVGVTVTGTDSESTQGKLYYYKQGLTAKIDYERFPHQLNHDPLNNIPGPDAPTFPPPPPLPATPPDPKIIKQDLNIGQNYVLRVQQLNASFKKDLNDDLQVRLDVWGLKKDGTRQVNAIAMCYTNSSGYGVANNLLPPDHPPLTQFTGNRCHVLSQMQTVDWITTEVKPVIAWKLGDSINLEYSRPMRNFSAGDSSASRFYNRTGNLSFAPAINPNPYQTGVVPDSYTQMDQLKLSGEITEDTKAYSYLMLGNTVNEMNHMNRWFNNADVRITNNSIQNVCITGYGTIFNEDESKPDLATITAINQDRYLNQVPPNTRPTQAQVANQNVHPLNYRRSTGGLKGVWRPWGGGYSRDGLALVAGYEYCDLERSFAIFPLTSGSVAFPTGGVADQSQTITNSFQIGPDYRWSERFDTYLHYKHQKADQPLFGVQPFNGVFNSILPQYDNIVEIGFNWVPSDWLVFNACIGVEKGENHQVFGAQTWEHINFDEENYPMSFNVWYAANQKLSFSAGYAVYSNFVGQDINVADQSTYTGSNAASAAAPVTGRWNYGGRAQVINVGSQYSANDRLIFMGQIEWIRGNNAISNSPMVFPGNVVVTDLGTYSEVLNETTRFTVGMDWKITPRIVNYYRYELYDFKDIAPGYQSGTAQGILGGLSAFF
jgi:hypothetical protein